MRDAIATLGILLGIALATCTTPHSVPTAPKPSVAVPAANDASLHPGGEVADASTTLAPADEQDAVTTPAVSLDQVAAAVPPAPAPVSTAAKGYWATVQEPIYGGWRGRQIVGYRNVQRWYSTQPVRYQPTYQYGGGCANGSCGRR